MQRIRIYYLSRAHHLLRFCQWNTIEPYFVITFEKPVDVEYFDLIRVVIFLLYRLHCFTIKRILSFCTVLKGAEPFDF
jgi:hypothetical protein